MARSPLLLVLVGLAVASTRASAQDRDTSLWSYDPPGDIGYYEQGPLGNILLGTNKVMESIDLETGTPRWQRDDLTHLDYWRLSIVPMTTVGIIRTGNRMMAMDVADGKTLWDESALPFQTIRGYMADPAHGLLLIYGKTEQSDQTLIGLDLFSGTVLWRHDDLFNKKPPLDCVPNQGGPLQKCPTIRLGWRQVLAGHQHPLADTDSSFVLYISKDGPVRLQARTGAVLWRASQLRGKDIPRLSRGFASWFRRDSVLYVPTERKLMAIDLHNGSTIWFHKHKFRGPITQMAFTDDGLVVRGDGFVELLDSATGASVWQPPKHKLWQVLVAPPRREATIGPFLVHGDRLFLLHPTKLEVVSLRDKRERTFKLRLKTKLTAKGRQTLGTADGMQIVGDEIVITAPQQVLGMGADGKTAYHLYYEPPKYSWWQNALGSVISGAISVATVSVVESMRDYNPQDFTWTNAQGEPTAAPNRQAQEYAQVYHAIYQPKIQDRMMATLSAAHYAYINTGESDGSRKGFNLVRVDERDGSVAGRLFLGEREPHYRIDPATGILLLKHGGTIAAYRYPSP